MLNLKPLLAAADAKQANSTLLLVSRDEYGADFTQSRLLLRDHPTRIYHGVEDERRKNGVVVRGETCIPEGTYPLALRQSLRFSHHYYVHRDQPNGILLAKSRYDALSAKQQVLYRPHDAIWIQNVPNFQYILLHWGNTDDDTDGCYCVGRQRGIVNKQPGVVESRIGYEELYPLIVPAIRAGNQFITYRDDQSVKNI